MLSSNNQERHVELEEAQEKPPSLKKYVHQKTWVIKGQLNNIKITKKDYSRYLDGANKEARDVFRKHNYFKGAESAMAFKRWQNEKENEFRALTVEIIMAKEKRFRKQLKEAEAWAINEFRALTVEIKKAKQNRLRKQLKAAEARAIKEHKKLVIDFNTPYIKTTAEGAFPRISREKSAILSLKEGYVPILEKDNKNFLAANKAINECNRSLKSSPHELEAVHVLGILYILVGKFTEDSNVEERIDQTLLLIEAGLIKQPSSFQKKMPSDGCRLEEKSAQLLSAMGFRTLNTKFTADGGIDIYAFSDEPVKSGKYIVQCKDWSQPVGEPVLRDLYGLIIAEAANKGIVIATSGFTAAATNFVQNKQLELIDGEQFEALLRQFDIP